MTKLISISLLALTSLLLSQNSTKDNIEKVNLDLLVKHVRVLSGEDSLYINQENTIITHRVSDYDNELAAQYIFQELSKHIPNVELQKYSDYGTNIIGTQTGSLYPDSILIVCGHYDAVNYFCADDNASSTSAILELARIFGKQKFEKTIVYALWDEEEKGLIGSRFYANKAKEEEKAIIGVLNMEMLGYDSNNDNLFDIHINDDPKSTYLKDVLIAVNEEQEIGLEPNVIFPGVTASDHSNFWNNGYPAIVYGESFFGGDPNPAYHTANDKIDLFNMDYFEKLSKLTVGAVTELAVPVNGVNFILQDHESEAEFAKIYPNPSNSDIKIESELKIDKIQVFNNTGLKIMEFYYKDFEISLNLDTLPPGTYIIALLSEDKVQRKKLIRY